MSAAGLDLIKSFEGFRAQPYYCAGGKLTVGYGHTSGVWQGMRVSEKDADVFLRVDVQRIEREVDELVKVPLSQGQYDALISFTFNVGVGALQKSTLLRLLNEGNYAAVPEQMKRWTKAGGKDLPGLVRRREAEAELFGG